MSDQTLHTDVKHRGVGATRPSGYDIAIPQSAKEVSAVQNARIPFLG